jgi:hypothetical protein
MPHRGYTCDGRLFFVLPRWGIDFRLRFFSTRLLSRWDILLRLIADYDFVLYGEKFAVIKTKAIIMLRMIAFVFICQYD